MMDTEERKALVEAFRQEVSEFLMPMAAEAAAQSLHTVLAERQAVPDAERVERAAEEFYSALPSIMQQLDGVPLHEPWEWQDEPVKEVCRRSCRAALTAAGPEDSHEIVPDPRRIDTGYDLQDGERIHEGDVLECECEGRQLVTWEPLMSSWIVRGVGEFTYFDDDGNERTHPFDHVTELKEYISWHGKLSTFSRIGSVYDNPELIESLEIPRRQAAAGPEPSVDLTTAYMAGVAKGEDWLDAALNSVHPGCYISYVVQDTGTQSECWRACIRWPYESRKSGTFPHHDSVATGPTRTAAVLNAIAMATKGNSNEQV